MKITIYACPRCHGRKVTYLNSGKLSGKSTMQCVECGYSGNSNKFALREDIYV